MGKLEINSRKPSTFEVAVTRVVSQTLALERGAESETVNSEIICE